MVDIDLRLGDCLEILPTLADGSVDAVITDVPYGTTACSWDEVIPLDEMWREAKRVTDLFITTSSQPFTSRLVVSNLDWFRHEIVWRKTIGTGHMNANKMPIKKHENILVFYKHLHNYNPQFTEGKPYKDNRGDYGLRHGNEIYGDCTLRYAPIDNDGFRYPVSVIEISNPNNGKVHPTQKPVALYEYLVRTYTNKGDTVLDIAMGSGTTGVACVQTGRNFIGIEIEPKYYEIAEKRIAEAQLQMRMPI
jgi:DNA modification methylase